MMWMANRLAAGLLAALLLLGGCSWFGHGDGDSTATAQNKLAQVTDVPLPSGYSVDNSNTIIFGEGERLSGRLVYSINSGPDEMFDFFRREMPKLGWAEISVFRAKTSVMTYSRGSRVTTIQVSPRTLYGSNVEMVIAPTTNGGASSTSGTLRPDDMQPMAPANNRDVTSQPLK
jgi:hypothetical protein